MAGAANVSALNLNAQMLNSSSKTIIFLPYMKTHGEDIARGQGSISFLTFFSPKKQR